MHLHLELAAPGSDRPAGSVMAERNRTTAISRALVDIAASLANTGAREGGIRRDHIAGIFTITYEGA
jgi:hypothetical protein